VIALVDGLQLGLDTNYFIGAESASIVEAVVQMVFFLGWLALGCFRLLCTILCISDLLAMLPTCRRNVSPTAKSRHIWPTGPRQADTNSFPTLFLCWGLPTFSKFSPRTRVRMYAQPWL